MPARPACGYQIFSVWSGIMGFERNVPRRQVEHDRLIVVRKPKRETKKGPRVIEHEPAQEINTYKYILFFVFFYYDRYKFNNWHSNRRLKDCFECNCSKKWTLNTCQHLYEASVWWEKSVSGKTTRDSSGSGPGPTTGKYSRNNHCSCWDKLYTCSASCTLISGPIWSKVATNSPGPRSDETI